jgi:hypothetical protein
MIRGVLKKLLKSSLENDAWDLFRFSHCRIGSLPNIGKRYKVNDWKPRRRWISCVARRTTGWKCLLGIVKASTAFASMTSGASALSGQKKERSMWK